MANEIAVHISFPFLNLSRLLSLRAVPWKWQKDFGMNVGIKRRCVKIIPFGNDVGL